MQVATIESAQLVELPVEINLPDTNNEQVLLSAIDAELDRLDGKTQEPVQDLIIPDLKPFETMIEEHIAKQCIKQFGKFHKYKFVVYLRAFKSVQFLMQAGNTITVICQVPSLDAVNTNDFWQSLNRLVRSFPRLHRSANLLLRRSALEEFKQLYEGPFKNWPVVKVDDVYRMLKLARWSEIEETQTITLTHKATGVTVKFDLPWGINHEEAYNRARIELSRKAQEIRMFNQIRQGL